MRSSTEKRTAWVHVWLPGRAEPALCGRLRERDRQLLFSYAPGYLGLTGAIALDPVELPLGRGRSTPPGGELHSALRDASPDAWGRRVQLARIGGVALDELGFLLGAGPDRIGALAVTSAPTPSTEEAAGNATLEELMTAAQHVEAGVPMTEALAAALLHGTSIGGARPKALLDEPDRRWIAKFSSSSDHFPVVGAEHAAMVLAAQCGLTVPAVRGLRCLGRDVLLVERFDRTPLGGGRWARRHLLSGLTVLRLHESEASLASYLDLAGALRQRARDPARDLRELFRRMVFNLLVGNTDDHARNHSVFWDGSRFDLTPAYDICPSLRAGRTTSQAMVVGTDGRRSTLRNACSEAGLFGLDSTEARRLCDELVEQVRVLWPEAADLAGLTRQDRERLERETVLGPGCFE